MCIDNSNRVLHKMFMMIPRPATKDEIIGLVERAIQVAGSVEKLAEMTGWSVRAINYYKKCEQRPSPARMDKLIEIAGVSDEPPSVNEIPAEYGNSAYVEVPLWDAAGQEVQQHLKFRRSWLEALYVKVDNLFCVLMQGGSMSPTIPDGSVIMIDRGRNKFANNKICYIKYGGEELIRRLVGTERDFGVASDSDPSHVDDVKRGGEPVDSSNFEIIGRAFWTGRIID